MTTSHLQRDDTPVCDEQATEAPPVGAGLAETIADVLAGTKWACSADEMRPAR